MSKQTGITAAFRRAMTFITVVGVLLFCGCTKMTTIPESIPTNGGLQSIQPNDDIDTKMEKFAEQAVIDFWQNYKLILDYSPASVEEVERILGKMQTRVTREQITDKDIRAEAVIIGSYIGEVIRREKGGQWKENDDVAGPGSYPLLWKERRSYPYAWCYKRLTVGQEENVWHKYLHFVKNETPGGTTINNIDIERSSEE